jgi:hypothetical protein
VAQTRPADNYVQRSNAAGRYCVRVTSDPETMPYHHVRTATVSGLPFGREYRLNGKELFAKLCRAGLSGTIHNPSTLWAAAILLSLAHDGLPEHNYQQTQANHNEHDVMV